MTPEKELSTNIFSQFLALLYKELLLRKRHYIGTSFEIIFPIIIASIPCMLYNGIPELEAQKRQDFQWVDLTTFTPTDPMDMHGGFSGDNVEFVYAPSNDVTDQFMADSLRAYFGRSQQNDIKIPKKMNSEKELKKYILEEQILDEGKEIIGTVFKGFGSNLPKNLNYKIYYTKDFDTRSKYYLNGPPFYTDYAYSYFIPWQTVVGNTFIEKKAAEYNKEIGYKIFLQAFPYPAYKKTPPGPIFVIYEAEFYIHVALIFFVAAILKRLIQEKNDGSKELMESMGMTKSPYWASTFMNNFITAFILSLVITIIYKASSKNTELYVQTDFILLFIILLLFMANLILFCMTFSIFFNRVAYAVIALLMVYLLSLKLLASEVDGNQFVQDYFSYSQFHKLCICIHPIGSLLTSFLIIHLFEMNNEGVQWRNLTEYTSIPDINMLMVVAMMVFSCFLYLAALWYFDAVWPWQSGERKPFYFFLTKSYWYGETPVFPNEIELVSNENSVDNFDVEPRGALRSVVIKDLSKVILQGSSSKKVLRDVSLKCFQGQITTLVGHSEAGKTSLINILTGKELSTSGSVFIIGLDILKNRSRMLLGVCPQRNILYDELSVEQHLKIYAAMKGTSLKQLACEAEKVLNSLKLSSKKAEIVSNLSYAEKRKLSLAIAIVGGSKVLLLDEPTYGMDDEARRHVWDALQAIKHDRTIIVSTQSFKNADALGDRIAVMAEGEIQSCGTPAFIKQKLGNGYHLHVQKAVHFDLNGLKSVIGKHVSTVTLENESLKKASFNLGSDNELGKLFEELENRKKDLGISTYGVSYSTIRDVSLMVSHIVQTKQSSSTAREIEDTSFATEDVSRDPFHPALHTSILNQFQALLLKHFHCCKRRWKFHAVQLVIPFLLMLMCFYFIKASMTSRSQPLNLDISSVYGSTDGFYFNSDPTTADLAERFKKVLESNDVSVQSVSEPTHYVLQYGEKDLAKYLKRLVVGGVFNTLPSGLLNLTAWYNSGSHHSLPMSLLMMQTTLLRHVTSTGRVSLAIEPVVSLRSKSNVLNFSVASDFMPLIFTFLSLTFILSATRETGTKTLQLMSGIPAGMYWFARFLFDYLTHFVVCIFLIMPPAFFFPSVFFGKHSEAIGSFLFIFLLYGWASLPLGYIVTIFLRRENRGLFIFIGFCILFSVVSIFLFAKIGFYLFLRYSEPSSKVLDALWFFRLFPLFSVSWGTQMNLETAFHNAECDIFTPADFARCELASPSSSLTLFRCCKDVCEGNLQSCHKNFKYLSLNKTENYMSNGPEALFLGLEGIIFFAILFLLETRTAIKFLKVIELHLQSLWNQITRVVLRRGNQIPKDESRTDDSQVLQEEERLRNLVETQQGSGDKSLVVLGLTKNCGIISTVKHLTFGVNGEECFGILGVKGAKKTSIFSMLTGDDVPLEGSAFIKNYSLNGDCTKFLTHIGYCPEVDPLIEDLTGREMLLLFGQLRGLRGHELPKNVNDLIQSMGLTNCADELTQVYSKGNKRKLSVAIALMGSPPVLLLDEPTAGTGPESHRLIQRVLCRNRKRTGAAILLATQSLEESEALCDRLAIMVNGRFRCLKSVEQLQSKHGQEYVLTILMSKENQDDAEKVNALKNHTQNSLKNSTLTDHYRGMLQYQVKDPSMTIDHLYKFMSDVKARFGVEDFSIGPVFLEETFVTCSRE